MASVPVLQATATLSMLKLARDGILWSRSLVVDFWNNDVSNWLHKVPEVLRFLIGAEIANFIEWCEPEPRPPSTRNIRLRFEIPLAVFSLDSASGQPSRHRIDSGLGDKLSSLGEELFQMNCAVHRNLAEPSFTRSKECGYPGRDLKNN